MNSKSCLTTMRYFISGHIDVNYDDFLLHYKTNIDFALKEENCSFVIGDAPGVDTHAQHYLHDKIDKSKVTIYHRGSFTRNNTYKYPTSGNYFDHFDKDRAMTENSDADILWIRSKEETKKLYGSKYREDRISGTEKNLIRREQINKKSNLIK